MTCVVPRLGLPGIVLASLLLAAPAWAQDDSCEYANDGECDEPDICEPGTDTTDCAAGDETAEEDEEAVEAGPVLAYEDLSPEEQAEVDTFVVGNTVWTLYHELGHALVDLLGLPVLGREEDAVDNLATVLMVSGEPDETLEEMVIGAADVWYYLDAAAVAEGYDEPDYADEHSLDLQRFYTIVCLIYGSDPEGYQELADYEELPVDRQEGCAWEYDQAKTSWDTVLAPHRPTGEPAGRVIYEYEEPGEEFARLVQVIQDSEFVQGFPAEVEAMVDLPVDLNVWFARCGEDNAYYDPENQAIWICYEMLTGLETLILDEIAAR